MNLSHTTCCLFFNDPATTEIYTLSLHDALPIWVHAIEQGRLDGLLDDLVHVGLLRDRRNDVGELRDHVLGDRLGRRSEEHTSELQSRQYLVCSLLLEKKKT